MINVDQVFLDCRHLLSKDKAGYMSSDEFNRSSIVAEQLLFRFHVTHFEEHGMLADAMYPFNKLAVLSLDSNARFTIPSDFARRNVLWRKKMTNTGDGGSTSELVKIQYLEKEELQDTLDSAIRGPNLDKNRMYYTFVAGKAQIYPAIPGPVEFDYLRNPVYAVRGFTVDIDTMEEEYDSTSSTNYEWLENERPQIVALILMQYGLVLREFDVVNWAMQQNANAQNIKQL